MMSVVEPRFEFGRQLDFFDRNLVRELERDGRASLSELATRLGTTRATVQARLSKLLETNTLRIVGLTDPGILGRPVIACIKVRTSTNPAKLAQRMSDMAPVHWVATTTAVTTVLAQVAFADNQELSRFVDDELRAIAGVETVTVNIALAVYNPVSSDDSESNRSWLRDARDNVGFDEADLAIIAQLRIDGRTPYVKLGQITGLSTPAARQRALRLFADGVVRIRALVDPDAAGLVARGEVHLLVNADARRIAQQLATLPHVAYVVQTFGSCDIYVDLECTDLDELLHAVDRVARLDGVVSHRFFQYDLVFLTSPVWS